MAVMNITKGEAPDPKDLRKLFGPGHVAGMVNHAIQSCWMTMPAKRKTIEGLEKEFQRLVDRAFRNITEDESSLES